MAAYEAVRFTAAFVRVRTSDDPGGAVSSHSGPIGVAVSSQILRCGTSAGANYEEADDGSSPRDALAKKKIVLRELKECRWRLRLVRAAGLLTEAQDSVIDESDELVRIVSTIIRKSAQST